MSDTAVYLPGGTVSHRLKWNHSPNGAGSEALCGRTAWPGYWYGTGSQDEEEKAASLPLCVACAAIIRHRAGGVP
ncbi:hypothetical protein [Streptomyces sp. NPDC015131]|uniref:hypothetical protein n=1 Tax=Streptomyces sp. NPDC015131 TaxID=3364941 RepID=UPI0036F880F4